MIRLLSLLLIAACTSGVVYGQHCSVSLTQTLVSSWDTGSQWSVSISAGQQTVINVILSASNIVNIWPLNQLSQSQWSFPSYFSPLSPGAQVTIGYTTTQTSQVNFDIVQVSCQGSTSSPQILIDSFSVSSSFSEPASALVTVPSGYKLVGGGAYSDTYGYQLIASYPLNITTWFAQINPDVADIGPTTFTVFALGIRDPSNIFNTQIFVSPQVGVGSSTASATAYVPPPYVLCGGGALSSDFLYQSFPSSQSTWTAGFITNPALGGGFPSQAGVLAYAIGISGPTGLTNQITQNSITASSTAEEFFTSQIGVASQYVMSCGGALITNGLITASYPVSSSTWGVSAVADSQPVTLETYALGLASSSGAGCCSCQA